MSTLRPFSSPELFRVACFSLHLRDPTYLGLTQDTYFVFGGLSKHNMGYSDVSSHEFTQDSSSLKPQRRSELPAHGPSSCASNSDPRGCFPRDLPSYYHFNSSTDVLSPEPSPRWTERGAIFFGWRYALGSCMVCSRKFEAKNWSCFLRAQLVTPPYACIGKQYICFIKYKLPIGLTL